MMMSKALLTVERYFSHNITTQKVFLTCKQVTYTMPWAIIALATFRKPATLAPLT